MDQFLPPPPFLLIGNLAENVRNGQPETLDDVLVEFKNYCTPRKNVIFERYCFWSHSWVQNASVEKFVTGLKLNAASCEFGSASEELIRGKLVFSAPEGLKGKLLKETDLTLKKAVELCQVTKALASQLQTMINTAKQPCESATANMQAEKISLHVVRRQQPHSETEVSVVRYKNCSYCGMKYSPAEMLMGRMLRSKLPASNQKLHPKIPSGVREALQEVQDTQKFFHDQTAKSLRPLKEGDEVWVEGNRQWHPAVVIEQCQLPRTYRVQTSDGNIYRCNRIHLRCSQKEMGEEQKKYERCNQGAGNKALEELNSQEVNNSNQVTEEENQELNSSQRAERIPRCISSYGTPSSIKHFDIVLQMEFPCNLLSVKIIQIKNLRTADIFSQSNCYVSLFLPTASFERVQTKTIKDCQAPLWNEIFTFRIQKEVKNVLELMVHDEDYCLMDDHHLTVLFDVSKIQLGETICLTFPLDPKIQEELEVEFRLESIPVLLENIVTNGVLVSREISFLEVEVNLEKMKNEPTDKTLTFTVQGSCEETKNISLGSVRHPTEPVVFHYIKYQQSVLAIELSKKLCTTCFPRNTNAEEKVCLTLPMDPLSIKKEIAIDKNKTIDLSMKVQDWPRGLDVRLGYELCTEEKILVQKRKRIAAAALKKVLHLEQDLQDHEVPVVAAMATGGSSRAFTALHGHLFGLQKLNLLDCLSYISGSSGSTWAMSNLYEQADWSHQDLSGAIAQARKHMTKCKQSIFSLEKIKEYSHVLEQRQKEGYKTCFTDLWGLFIDKALGSGKPNSTLSGQKHALNHGQNPLPIYMVLNTRDKYSLSEFKEWMEFTPYEVGLLKYGAYIHSEDFGSKFFMGRLMKKVPESEICYMKGLWSNVFSYNLLDILHGHNVPDENFWHRCTRDSINNIEESPYQPLSSHQLDTYLVAPASKFAKFFREVLSKSLTLSEVYNFLHGFQLNNGYLDNKNFEIWKDTILDVLPNNLTTTPEYLSLADTAAYIDFSCPTLMRPERKVDVIVHLNYSSGSQTTTLIRASQYFAKQGIPFPKIDLSNVKETDLKECYVFEDAEDSRAPIVIFFPLINDSFRKCKAPGVKRSPSEMKQGEVDVTSAFSPYGLQDFTYTEEEFDKLVELTSYNIQNNKNMIYGALRRAVERKQKE
uniref:cytosolic phospholipase A2 epsilon-like n=1 Tax=Euleptes europaea TaxID=460621 RepID=UPI002541290A|nr:cytosolic phospholipase A2 epsilon-like [Euleptes europaea]